MLPVGQAPTKSSRWSEYGRVQGQGTPENEKPGVVVGELKPESEPPFQTTRATPPPVQTPLHAQKIQTLIHHGDLRRNVSYQH